jgi:RNA polymerase sigma-70 factor (ECF subfamily)
VQIQQLYDEYKNMVFNLALQYVQNTEDAEEITQDVFVKIHFSKDNFKNQSAWRTWIYRITINQSLDFLKAKKTQKRFAFITNLFHADSNEPRFQVSHFNHPGVQLEQKEATQAIFAAINALPEQQKNVIILAKIERLSHQQIAEILNISISALESLLSRAKANITKSLSTPKAN